MRSTSHSARHASSRGRSLSSAMALTVFLSACAGAGDSPLTLTVLAASSLTDLFGDAETAFESQHPGADVVVSTGGSQALRLQIEEGAKADVFASADYRQILALEQLGLIGTPTEFAGNRLVIVVPVDNPSGLESYEDLPQASRIVLGSPLVPVGHYSQGFLDRVSESLPGFREAVEAKVVSYENNVRLVLTKVELGEADAALVYLTDVLARGGENLVAIDIPDGLSGKVTYYMGVLRDAPNPGMAERWIEGLLEGSQPLLVDHGFLPRSQP